MGACRLARLALGLEQGGDQHVLHQRRFARARDACDADQSLERELDVDVLEVVFRGAEQAQSRRGFGDRSARRAEAGLAAP